MPVSLRPAGAGGGGLDGEDLTGPRAVVGLVETVPFLSDDEQGRPVGAAEYAGEAAAVRGHCVQHLTAFCDPDAVPLGHIGVPDRAFGVDAYAVGVVAAGSRPRPAAVQGAVGGDVKGGQSLAVGLGDDQG